MSEPACWCQTPNLVSFNEDYLRCSSCNTLLSRLHPENQVEYYGRDYWTNHQTKDLGHPDIHQRARLDLSERTLYWLETLLYYKQPPARTLELGCGHGGFVALLNQAGFEAAGLELNPWTADLARKRFDIPVLTGVLSKQTVEPGTFDAIILLDVLEHLSDPAETISLCRKLLKPDGILLVQTPSFPPGQSYKTLKNTASSFLKMLLPVEHLYLFCQHGAKRLMTQNGFVDVVFETALFPYDMFFVAGLAPLMKTGPVSAASSLTDSPGGLLVSGMLDLYHKSRDAEADNHHHHEQFQILNKQLQESERDRTVRLAQIEELTFLLQESEADRDARLEQVKTLTRRLQKVEKESQSRLAQVEKLSELLETAETDRAARLEQIRELSDLLEKSEADRDARLEQIRELSGLLEESEADRAARLEQIQELSGLLEISEADRAARLEQITDLADTIKTIERQLAQDQGNPGNGN